MQYLAPWFLRQSHYFNKFEIQLLFRLFISFVFRLSNYSVDPVLPVNQSIVEGNMNWLMSHQSFNCQQKVICLADPCYSKVGYGA